MKIGILTFHRAINYGAVLQCYALCEYLTGMGHDVDVIDYRPEYIEKYRRTIPLYDIKNRKGIIGKLKQTISSFLSMSGRIEARKRFDSFLSQNFSFSKPFTSNKAFPKGYDLIVFGSDQIWSPQICNGYDPIYWGQFSHKNTRLVTYAASLGGHNQLNKNEWEIVGRYLQSFSNISVREQQLQNDLQNRLGIASELVVDPTILVKEELFERVVEKPKNLPENYVLVFSVAPTDNLMGFAEKIASQTGSVIVKISANKPTFVGSAHNESCLTANPTVGEFLGWFKYAKCVVTVSFHGTVFSVLFRKDFYSLANYMQDRAEQLLESIGLADRLQKSDRATLDNLIFKHVDYTDVDEKLKSIRKKSIEYLNKSI